MPNPKYEATTGVAALNGHHQDTSRTSSTKNPEVQHETSLRGKLQGFPWRVFLITSLLPLCLAPIIILSAIAEMASQNYIRGRSCYPNGLWKEAAGATWRIMDSTYFFTPNLSFGNMTFTQVKVIDIAWDLLVGRGGQMCLAWVNWRVFNEWLVYHLERYRTSYKMYASVALQTTSLTNLGVLGKEFLCFGERTWGRFFRWLAMFSMFISTLYVLSFPTLMAAMTGYITTYEPYVDNYNRNLIGWGNVDEIVRSIDGGREIGFDEQYVWVTAREEELIQVIDSCKLRTVREKVYLTTFVVIGKFSDANNTFNQTYRMGDETQQYNDVAQNGTELQVFRVENGTNWEFENTVWTVRSAVTITTYWPTGKSLRDTTVLDQQYYSISGRYGEQYNSTWIKDHSSCKPSETYQWGFSYIFLFMVSIFNFLWSAIMICMWLDTRRASRMYKSGRRPGLLRSVLDLSAAVRDELGAEAEHLEEEELRQRLTDSGGALHVPKDELRVRRVGTAEFGTRKRTWTGKLTRGSTF